MNWYSVKLVFRVTTANGEHTPQFDEQFRLLQARNLNEAFLKARMIGGREEVAFMSEDFNAVNWQFIDVSELNEISAFTDGMELHSRIHEVEQAISYINYVHHRAASIEQLMQPQLASA